jgi:hypothetical protein
MKLRDQDAGWTEMGLPILIEATIVRYGVSRGFLGNEFRIESMDSPSPLLLMGT